MEEPMGEGRTVTREYDWEEVEPAVAVLESIAALEHGDDTDPTSVIDDPLTEHVETDALNTLVRSGNATSVTFRALDYYVRIRRNTVEVAHAYL